MYIDVYTYIYMDRLYAQTWGSWKLACMVFLPKGQTEQDPPLALFTGSSTPPYFYKELRQSPLGRSSSLGLGTHLQYHCLSPAQTGFLRGRHMLANVLNVDEDGMVAVAERDGHAQLFVDFGPHSRL